jgi:hypothetical protein
MNSVDDIDKSDRDNLILVLEYLGKVKDPQFYHLTKLLEDMCRNKFTKKIVADKDGNIKKDIR